MASAPQSREDYTIGWICALVTEYTASQEFLEEEFPPPFDQDDGGDGDDDNHYAHGRIGRHNVVIAVLPRGIYGTSSAATVATNLARSYPNVKAGVMVGIGGGAPSNTNDIRLGDVVVNEPGVFQYDFGKRSQAHPYEYKRMPNSPPAALLTGLAGLQSRHQRMGHNLEKHISDALGKNPRLINTHGRPKESSDILFKPDIIHSESCRGTCNQATADPENLVERVPRSEIGEDSLGETLQIHYGLIATGNSVGRDANFRDKLAAEHGVLCFEMEAGGLVNSFPCLVIRGICDYSDSHKNKQWQGYAAMAAAAYARDLLLEVNPRNLQSGTRLSEVLKEIYNKTTETQEQVKSVASYLKMQAGQQYLGWLSAENFGSQHSDIIKTRSRNTGQWFLESSEYQTWLSVNQQTLFCPGIPGAGKTMIMSIVISDLISRYHDDNSVGIAFVYHNYRRQELQGLETLLSSLLRQVATRCPSVPEPVKHLYNKHESSQTRPSCDELSSALHEVIGMFKRVYIVIDALDEYLTTGSQNELTKLLSQLQKDVSLNLIATSRHIPEIKAAFKSYPCLEISAATEDLTAYMKENIHKFPDAIQQDEELQCDIRTQLIDICQGMFLLTKLYMDVLYDKTSKRELRDAMNSLPRLETKADKSSSAKQRSMVLSKAYLGVLERIKAQPPSHLSLALRVLMWVTFAKEQLSVHTFQAAVCTIVGDRVFDMENLRDVDTLISRCYGLVVLDKESGVVRLVHYTTQDYLIEHKSAWAPTAHRDIALDCITHLMYDTPELDEKTIWRDAKRNMENARARREGCVDLASYDLNDLRNDFMRRLHLYSAKHWGHHFALSEDDVDGLREFLHTNNAVNLAGTRLAYAQGLTGFYPSDEMCEDLSSAKRAFTSFHLVAYFGLDSLLEITFHAVANLPKCPSVLAAVPNLYVDCNNMYFTPLQLAILGGHASTVQKLLALGVSKEPMVPLVYAASSGPVDIVKALVRSGADVNQRDEQFGYTALMVAAKRWKDSRLIVEFLIENNADPLIVDDCRDSALRFAVQSANFTSAKFLLEAGIDINSTNEDGQTSLMHACDFSLEPLKMTKFLIAHGADFRLVDRQGRTALFYALQHRGLEAAGFLLELGADINLKNKAGQNFLMLVLDNFNQEEHLYDITSFLLKKGINVADVDHSGRSALTRAPKGGANTVKLLLDAGADVNGKDCSGQTPLMSACKAPSSRDILLVLKLFIERGARIEDVDNEGKSALAHAIANSSMENAAILLLIEAGANIEEKDLRGEAPLMKACQGSRPTDKLKLLIEHGARVDDVDNEGRSALAHAITTGIYEAIEPLIEAGADVNRKDKILRTTPLMEACSILGDDGVKRSKLLLEKGVSIDDVDITRRSALAFAATYGHIEIVNLLLEAGADINRKDLTGETPLLKACHGRSENSLKISQLLLYKGARPEDAERYRNECVLKTKPGSCPLHGRAKQGWLTEFMTKYILDVKKS